MTNFDLEKALSYCLADCDVVTIAGQNVHVAPPARSKLPAKKPVPLLIVKGDAQSFASCVEMVRLMAGTREIEDSAAMLVSPDLEDEGLAAVIKAAAAMFNFDQTRILTVPDDLPSVEGVLGACPEAALAQILMARLGTARVYGQEMAVLRNPIVGALTSLLRPFAGALMARKAKAGQNCGTVMHAAQVGRDYEVFVSLPPSYHSDQTRAYPVLFALDSNLMFGVARAITHRLAAEGVIDDAIVVGVGMPRAEGATSFALRRLQEYAPPVDAYDFKDGVAKSLGPIYALAGRRMKDGFGQAAGLHDFIINDVLDGLKAALRVDDTRLALFGHSAGGTYVGFEMQQQDTPFSGFLCSSPGLAEPP